jgi:hypothetical protein
MKRFSFVTTLILISLAFMPSFLLCQSLSWQSIAPNITNAGVVVGKGAFLATHGSGPITRTGTNYIYTSLNGGITWSSTASIQWNNNTSGLRNMYFGDGVLFCGTNT